MAKRGRKANTESKRWVVSVLENNLQDVSYFLMRQLVNLGYVEVVKVPRATRGRPAVAYSVSKKGRNLLNLSRFWPKMAA